MKPEAPPRPSAGTAGIFGRAAAALVAASLRAPRLVLLLSALLGAWSVWVVATRFAMNTDIVRLFPEDLPWRQAELAMDRAFPHRMDAIAAVIDGATADLADRAAAALEAALEPRKALFREVSRPGAEPFFRRNALLFLDQADARQVTERLIAAQPLLGTLSADPTLSGVGRAVELIAEGVERGEGDPATLIPPLRAFQDAATAAASGRVPPFDWAALLTGRALDPLELRRFVLLRPVPDYSALAPVSAATAAVRDAVAALGLTPENGVRVRLTGELVIGDEEFATVFGGAIAENILSLASVAVLLWLGLRSMRLILPNLAVVELGLAVTAAFGLLAVGPFNPLSIAFAVMFIGLGVDFGIQYAVCLREQRHLMTDQPLKPALVSAADRAGEGIALAALALWAGFLSFYPTSYRGVAELGLVAAGGMAIAVAISLTTLPAMLLFTRPKPEREPVGYAALAPLDRLLKRRARPALFATGLVAIAAAACLPLLRFDSNPLNLRDPATEGAATFRDLMRRPETTPNTLSAVAPDLPAARALARRLETLPEVSGTGTLADFVPADQEPKLALIRDAADLLGPTLEPPLDNAPPAGGGDKDAAALGRAAAALARAAARRPGTPLAEAAAGLAASLRPLADDAAARARLEAARLPGLRATLDTIRIALQAGPVGLDDIPDSIRREWIAADGRARVEIRPSDLSDRSEAMDRFAGAVRSVAPDAVGTAVSVQASAATIRAAFAEAGAIATGLTLALLLVALRSWRLALLALAPLALAGLLTLATCALIDLPLDLANIIALPLLFAQGVAFDIYYVAAWARGERALLPSSLTRAVLYSALTNGTAFATLAFSDHPGTAGMGVLLTMSLLWALASVLLVLPPLLHAFARDGGAVPGGASLAAPPVAG
ncbi:MAG: MMPL family transporter [Acetobacteraceae bacterium]|nr:MMPL family transporter [Acetobacteraceae bacterium]